jgi:hypothetical protein
MLSQDSLPNNVWNLKNNGKKVKSNGTTIELYLVLVPEQEGLEVTCRNRRL